MTAKSAFVMSASEASLGTYRAMCCSLWSLPAKAPKPVLPSIAPFFERTDFAESCEETVFHRVPSYNTTDDRFWPTADVSVHYR